MDCKKFAAMLDSYADLSDEQLRELEEHAMNCEQCREELDFYRSIMNTAASLPTIEPPEDLLSRINDEIDKQNTHVRNRVFNSIVLNIRTNIRHYATAAACLLVGVVVGLNGRMISDLLSGNDSDGVIREKVSKVEETSAPDGYVPESEAVPEVSAAPSHQEQSNTVPETDHEKTTAEPNQNVSQPMRKVERSNSSSAPLISQQPVASVSSEWSAPVVTVRPAQSTETETAAPVSSQEVNSESEGAGDYNNADKYVITQEYHMPDEYAHSGETQEPGNEATEQPGVESYSIAGLDEQSEYGYADETRAASASVRVVPDQLIIESGSVDEVVSIMNALSIENTGVAYVASTSTFYTLLEKLDAAGINYSYAQNSESDKVSFKIILI